MRDISGYGPSVAAKYVDKRLCVSVGLSVCVPVRQNICEITGSNFTKFLVHLIYRVAICYVLPVLWKTSNPPPPEYDDTPLTPQRR